MIVPPLGRRLALISVAAVAGLVAWVPAALGVDEEPQEEPVRGGPVVTIPVETDDDAFAMVMVSAVAPQPELLPGALLEVEAQFIGSSIDAEVCVALEGHGCIGSLPVDPSGRVVGEIPIPGDVSAESYVVTLESPSLGIAQLGSLTVAGEVEAPTATTLPPTPDASESGEPTQSSIDPAAAPTLTPPLETDDGAWALLIGAIGVVLIGWIGIRDRRRHLGVANGARHRLSTLELPTATQLPDRQAERPSAVAARTVPLDPGEGYVLIALVNTDDGGMTELEVARYADLDAAMHGARVEAADSRSSGVMWWEVRKHGSTLPVWIIEGEMAPVGTDPAAPPGPDS